MDANPASTCQAAVMTAAGSSTSKAGMGGNRVTAPAVQAKANTVGSPDGELAFWVNDQLVEHYRPGNPIGTWLRASFHTGGF